MAKRLIWSKLAQEQKKDIFVFWNKQNKSKSYSRKLDSLFNSASEMLTIHPEIGKKTNVNNIRLKLVRDYWLAYKITETEIQILTVWNTQRDAKRFENLLKIIKL